jgi:hypothetical protein
MLSYSKCYDALTCNNTISYMYEELFKQKEAYAIKLFGWSKDSVVTLTSNRQHDELNSDMCNALSHCDLTTCNAFFCHYALQYVFNKTAKFHSCTIDIV